MAKPVNNFLTETVDKDKVDNLLKKNSDNSDYFNELVDKIVNSYCSQMDTIMKNLDIAISDPAYPITDVELESACLKLPNALYFAGEATEAIGIKSDIAKAVRIDRYNSAHMEAVGTVADKEASASSASQYEQIIESVYVRATKKIKQRVEAGYEMLTAIKKVISRRMLERELSGVESSRITGGVVRRRVEDE